VPPNFIVKYKDSEGDSVVIESNKDINNLFDPSREDIVRASIEDENQVGQGDSEVSD
jgi:hypothetical protein